MSLKTSIILCTYNEANYIENTIAKIEKIIENLELIIVDDNSTDGTKEIINRINQEKKYKVIFRKKSKGLASAFLRGFMETSGDHVGWLDTNMTESIPRFQEMSELLNSDNDIVILSRYVLFISISNLVSPLKILILSLFDSNNDSINLFALNESPESR